ncbi:hypothetical protein MIND_00026100 [Mycena indigotica]|uniref:Protein-tyrosine-phosphatase n=1 Tax=Mycena indigotica TaxID=2126181 RepID=A0A8H6TAV4_9AGAR|nr:uncharacterized protein MIND_00026100 [Mycena indigotica]KAF7315118.1 hypothetical protein MIND_00026100 [Mycena indigotica]
MSQPQSTVTLFLLAASPGPARASQSSFFAVACRRSRRQRPHQSDAELDAPRLDPVAMACGGVESPLRGPKRARSSHPYARPEQPVKRRALSLTLGLNLNFALSEMDQDASFSSLSFEPLPPDCEPPPPSGAPLRADDPALAPYLSSQPSFSLLTSNIAIGDLAFAEDVDSLEREGITHVVSVISERVHVPDCIPETNRLHIPLPDAPFAELVGALEPVLDWVKSALASEKETPVRILIHCAHGISRSPAIGAALLVALPLIRDSPLSAVAALQYVQERRPPADVNWGFRAQLGEWEEMCRSRGL